VRRVLGAAVAAGLSFGAVAYVAAEDEPPVDHVSVRAGEGLWTVAARLCPENVNGQFQALQAANPWYTAGLHPGTVLHNPVGSCVAPATTTSSSSTTTTTEVPPSTTTTVAPTTTTASSSTTTSSTSTTSTTTTQPPSSGKPGLNNTGPTSNPDGFARLTAAQVEARMAPGAVISNVYITGGNVDLVASNVTIRNFVLDAAGASYGFVIRNTFTGLTLEDGEIFNPASAGILGTGFTARRLEIHHSGGDAIKAQPAGGSGGPVLVEASWWHHLGTAAGAHGDGNQTQVGSPHPIVFRGNNCDMQRPLAGTTHTSCLMTSESRSSSIVFENNWLEGGAFTIYCEPASNNITIRNNRFGRRNLYGVRGSDPCAVWVGNVWDDNGQPVGQ
jgi:hypothetical protein